MQLCSVSVSAYDHITANPLDTIGTRKLNVVELAEYSGQGRRGRCKCCMFYNSFVFILEISKDRLLSNIKDSGNTSVVCFLAHLSSSRTKELHVLYAFDILRFATVEM